jgi:hypothetical protein
MLPARRNLGAGPAGCPAGGAWGAVNLHEGTPLGTWYSEQSELAEAATPPHARNRSDSIYSNNASKFAQNLYFGTFLPDERSLAVDRH